MTSGGWTYEFIATGSRFINGFGIGLTDPGVQRVVEEQFRPVFSFGVMSCEIGPAPVPTTVAHVVTFHALAECAAMLAEVRELLTPAKRAQWDEIVAEMQPNARAQLDEMAGEILERAARDDEPQHG
jgi:hypothetical protein